MTKIGQFSSDVPPERSDSTDRRRPTEQREVNIHEEYRQFQTDASKKFERYRENILKELNTYENTWTYGLDRFTGNTETGLEASSASSGLEMATFDIKANTGIEPPSTGEIYSEYDEETGITTTYDRNQNKITQTNRDGEIISVKPMGTPNVTIEAPTDTPPTPVQAPTTAPPDNEKLHMADFMSNISDKTKEYLKNDQTFTVQSNEYIRLDDEKQTLKGELASARRILESAKENYENTSYNNFEAKYNAQQTYMNAIETVQNLQYQIMNIENSQKILTKHMVQYAQTIENWEDGTQIKVTSQTTGRGTYERVYTRETLPSGEKVYTWNGQQFPLAPNGDPSPEFIAELDNIVL